jgi:hypothetical protein
MTNGIALEVGTVVLGVVETAVGMARASPSSGIKRALP